MTRKKSHSKSAPDNGGINRASSTPSANPFNTPAPGSNKDTANLTVADGLAATGNGQQPHRSHMHQPSSKRLRSEEGPADAAVAPATKKSKISRIDDAPHPGKIALQSVDTDTDPRIPAKPSILERRLDIPAEVQGLTSKYDFTSMSIITSSKLEQKIRNVLERVNKFSCADTRCKPGIVILHAKQDIVARMVSIAEISKKEMARDKGKWYQYTKLEGHVLPMKQKKPRRKLQHLPSEGKGTAQDQTKPYISTDAQAAVGKETDTSTEVPATAQQADHGDIVETDEDEGESEPAFESMKQPRGQDECSGTTGACQKVRNTGIMSIYLSRVPVPELKALYGEQTNA